ncbi:MAG TPA: DUF4342 domain-containing protein [Anaerolineae bacterium]|nr:DUF4342 domain-containing protein [Anaerolineae bacterium]
MNDEEKVVEAEETQAQEPEQEPVEEPVADEAVEEEPPAAEKVTMTEEIKVQAQDLFQLINDVIREGTAKRITVLRNDRVLLDIPLVLGVAASVILAVEMPILSALVAVGALFGGCTVRIERDEG